MVVASAVGSDEQDLVSTDHSAHKALDNADALNALPRIADEACVATRERDELEELRPSHAVLRHHRVRLLCERLKWR